MASLTAPLRSLMRARALPMVHSCPIGYSSSALAGPSRLGFTSAVPSARAHLTTSTRSPAHYKPSRISGSCSRRWNSSATPAGNRQSLQREAESTTTSESGSENLRLAAPAPGAKSQQLAQIQPRLSLTFTCTADDCNHRSTHEFTKQAYTKGIVLVQCPKCKNRHLIADHLGWFKESTEEGTLKTIEDLLRAKGETVRTGKINWDGDIEYSGESKADAADAEVVRELSER